MFSYFIDFPDGVGISVNAGYVFICVVVDTLLGVCGMFGYLSFLVSYFLSLVNLRWDAILLNDFLKKNVTLLALVVVKEC